MKTNKLSVMIYLFTITFLLFGCATNDKRDETPDVTAFEIASPAHKETIKRIIYLTFDDGPSEYTDELLNVLDKYNVKATFFVTADNPSYLSMIKEETDDGHKVGIHAYMHKNVLSKVYNSYELSFDRMQEIIKNQTGYETDIYRFPGGSSNTLAPDMMEGYIKTFNERGYEYYDWDIDSLDSKNDVTSEQVLDTMKNGVLDSKEYSMILCHDIYSHTVSAIEEFIPWAIENNFEFKIIDENTPVVHHNLQNGGNNQ